MSSVQDEGLINSMKVFSRYLGDGDVRSRMRLIDRTFKEYPEFFGYGIYSFSKAG
jgi:hypothetical protein